MLSHDAMLSKSRLSSSNENISYINSVKIYPDLEILISPIKGCSQLRINQLLTIYQGVHITYFRAATPNHLERELTNPHQNKQFFVTIFNLKNPNFSFVFFN